MLACRSGVIEALRWGLSPERASGVLQRMLTRPSSAMMTIHTVLHAKSRGKLCRLILELLARGHKS
jgi:hypothetical protein